MNAYPVKGLLSRLRKNKEIDLPINYYDSTPRPVMCIRSDNDVWKGGGDPHHKLTVGKIYNASSIVDCGDYTLIYLPELDEEFNSVLFRELTKKERKNYIKNNYTSFTTLRSDEREDYLF